MVGFGGSGGLKLVGSLGVGQGGGGGVLGVGESRVLLELGVPFDRPIAKTLAASSYLFFTKWILI